jgi:hypothetical protein
MDDEQESDVIAGICKTAEEAYLTMTDRSTDATTEESSQFALALALLSLETLVELRRSSGDDAVYRAIAAVEELGPGRLRLLASQAVLELADLGFRLDRPDDDDDD